MLARTLVVRPDGKVLVLRRSPDDDLWPGAFDLPGGQVEPGESYLQAAIRETEEETGIRLAPDNVCLVHASTGEDTTKGELKMRFLFVAHVGKVTISLNPEHDAYWWYIPPEVQQAFAGTNWELAVNFVLDHNLLRL
ncbi:MAG TPA: NUDIX hydrolase [Candidatus Saccharimonadales bacterium]|nr:NUDIX hydrolase [Candidatus Saccharimonadales bacterium]